MVPVHSILHRPSRTAVWRRWWAAVALSATVALTGAGGSAADAAQPLPVPYSVATAVLAGNVAPDTAPPGANDWSCHPSAAHPRPVVLVHGTLANQRMNWDSLAPLLRNRGYCVFALNYGGNGINPVNLGVEPIEESSATLARFVDTVLASTGVSQVDIVGHSQGGLMPRYYLRYLGGAAKVHQLIGLGPTNHGGTVSGIATLEVLLQRLGLGAAYQLTDLACPACTQQYVGSAFLAGLNAGGDTVPDVRYTVIATRYDELASPYTRDFLTGPAVTNLTVQDGCPVDAVGHVGLAFDPRALALVVRALDPTDRSPIPCYPSPFAG